MQKSIKFPTPPDQAEYIRQLTYTIEEVAQEAAIEIIVVAMPGIVKDGVAVWCNNLKWSSFNVQSALQHYFPNTTILVENDANLGGLGEVRRTRPIPASALYVTVSTGIGTGYIVDGRIDPGLRLSEGGRALVEFDGVVQEWEAFASGSAIVRTYGKYARDIHDSKTWHHIADRISRGFLAIIPIIQPDVIIIGGSIGSYFTQYHETLVGLLREHLPHHIPVPIFIQAHTPEEAVIYGCYYYGRDHLAH